MNEKNSTKQNANQLIKIIWGAVFMLIVILGAISSCTKSENKTSVTNVSKTAKIGQEPRRMECQKKNSMAFCRCVINHVTKNAGSFEGGAWLEGGELTSAKARRALIESVSLCDGL